MEEMVKQSLYGTITGPEASWRLSLPDLKTAGT